VQYLVLTNVTGPLVMINKSFIKYIIYCHTIHLQS